MCPTPFGWGYMRRTGWCWVAGMFDMCRVFLVFLPSLVQFPTSKFVKGWGRRFHEPRFPLGRFTPIPRNEFFFIQSHVEIIPYHTLVALPNPRVKPDVPLVGHRSSSDSTGGFRDLVGLGWCPRCLRTTLAQSCGRQVDPTGVLGLGDSSGS